MTEGVAAEQREPGGDGTDTLIRALQRDADLRERQHLRRRLVETEGIGKYVVRDGRRLLNLAGNDYLALATHPRLIEAATQATRIYGTGSSASRLITGTLPPHHRLEQRFATFKHAPAALLFPTGTMANLGVLTALARPGDRIYQDRLNHACLLDGARYSGATVRTFPHRNYDRLAKLLQTRPADGKFRPMWETPRTFVTTDAVFSMDGTVADLQCLLELCASHEAVLILDEAHGTGVLGRDGSGLAEHQGVAGRVPITVSTGSKALGGLGGIVTAHQAVIETLIHHARTFIYTTAPPPSVPAALSAALDVLHEEPQRRTRLHEIIRSVRSGLKAQGWSVGEDPTPIVPLIVGDNASALALADRFARHEILAVAIRPPTVRSGQARVRLSLRADLSDDDAERLLQAAGRPNESRGPAT
jgi:8-amino-7-oxononanoate synthase